MLVFVSAFYADCFAAVAQIHYRKAADKPQVHLLSKIAFQCPMQFRNLKAQKANNRPITTLIVYFSRLGNTEYPSDVDATTSASIVVDKRSSLWYNRVCR